MIKNIKQILYLLLFSFFILSIALQTETVRSKAKDYITEMILAETGYHVTIENLYLYPSFQITAEGIRISENKQINNTLTNNTKTNNTQINDTQTLIATADKLHALITPTIIYGKEINLKFLSIDNLNFGDIEHSMDITGDLTIIPEHLNLSGSIRINLDRTPDDWVDLTIDHKKDQGELSIHTSMRQHGHCVYAILPENVLEISSLHATQGPIVIDGKATILSSGELLNSTFYFSASDVSHIIPVKGEIEGVARIQGSILAPKMNLTISSRKLNIQGEIFEQVKATLASYPVSGDLAGSLTISFVKDKFPYQFSSQISWEESIGIIPNKIKARTNLRELSQLLDIDIAQAEGYLALTIEYKDKNFDIQASVEDGVFESYEFGTLLTNGQAKITGDKTRISLTSFSAKDGETGTVTGSGWIDLDAENNFPFNFKFQISNAIALQLDNRKGKVSGDLALSGSLEKSIISGDLTVDSIEIDLPDQTSQDIEGFKVTYVNQLLTEDAPTIITKKAPDMPLFFDLKVNIPGNVKIRGKNLSTLWKGSVVVTGSSENLEVFGDIKLIDGRYSFRGKQLTLSQGIITFAGDPEKKTTLYVIATLAIDKVTVEAITKGVIGKTSITLRSSPAMSQREILSWLLFNRSAAEITPLEGAQLNQSLLTLEDTGDSGPDMITQLGNTFGLDRIEIGQHMGESKEGVSVQLGKYIADGTYLSISTNINSDPNSPTEPNCVGGIETDLGGHMKLQVEVDDRSNGQLNLLWKKDY